MLDARVPAHDIDAEQAILSAVFIRPSVLDDCMDIEPDDFYMTKNGDVFRAMLAIKKAGDPVDLITVAKHLQAAGKLKAIGGAAYLSEIADSAPVAINARAYAQIIRKHALNRRVMDAASRIMSEALDGADGDTLLEMAQSTMMGIQATVADDNIIRVADMIQDHISRIEHANTHREDRGYKTGFPNIDNCLSVIGPKLILIAARPKVGKTAFACTIIRNMDRLGVCCGLLSIEMPGSEILDRWLAQQSRVNSQKFGRYHGLSDSEWMAVADASNMMMESNILMDDSGSIGIDTVKRKCRKMVMAGARVIFIDQLSQIKGRTNDRFDRYAENVNELALLKKELGIPIFLLCQLNRKLEERTNKEPIMSDLKMTGNLEEDADAVIFLHRPEVFAKDDHERDALKGLAVVNLALNRHGGTFRDTNIMFHHETTYYYQTEKTPF